MPNSVGMMTAKELKPWANSYADLTGFDLTRCNLVEAEANKFWDVNYAAVASGAMPLNQAYDLPYYWEYVCACFAKHTLATVSKAMWWMTLVPENMPKKVLVLADGIGGASWFLAHCFPELEIHAQILGNDEMRQRSAALLASSDASKQVRVFHDFEVSQDHAADCILAFEFFEHLRDPFAYVRALPRADVLFHRSPFNVRVHGHFHDYADGSIIHPSDAMGRAFGKELRALNYAPAHHFFNGVPTVVRQKKIEPAS